MISVIMSCHKSNKQYLFAAVSSILGQTYKDFEFLVADNGGNDFGLKNFLQDFHDKRIIYVDNGGNIGAANSYNNLAKLAKGEYIAIQDHDDISVPQRLQEEKRALDALPSVQSVSSAITIFGEGRKEKVDGQGMCPEDVRENLYFWQPIKQPTFMKRREFAKNYFYDEKYFIYDYEFWSRTKDFPHYIINDSLLFYRKSASNSTKERALKVRAEHALITQRNFAEIGVVLPIETCEMLDPYNHRKYPQIFVDIFAQQYVRITEYINPKLFSFMLSLMLSKVGA